MSYVYKNGNKYLYKKRIPNSKHFYSFTLSTNKKKSEKIAHYFNLLSRNFFILLRDLKMEKWDYDEVIRVLDNYKEKALIEYSNLEKTRHISLSKLFLITKEIFGKKEFLSGAQPEVIDKALEAYEWLALSYADDKKPIIVRRV